MSILKISQHPENFTWFPLCTTISCNFIENKMFARFLIFNFITFQLYTFLLLNLIFNLISIEVVSINKVVCLNFYLFQKQFSVNLSISKTSSTQIIRLFTFKIHLSDNSSHQTASLMSWNLHLSQRNKDKLLELKMREIIYVLFEVFNFGTIFNNS